MHIRVIKYISITIVCLNIFANASKNDTSAKLEYATSIVKMMQLLDMEKELMQNLNEYADLMEDKIKKTQLFVSTLNREKDKSSNDPESYLSNPLNSFSVIRRLQSDWRKWLEYLKQPVGQDKVDFMESIRLKMPTNEDYEEATVGIHRLQLTYLLKAKDLAAGQIGGKQFDIKVSSLDCFAMGKYLRKLKLYSHALEWFEQAREQFLPSHAKIYEILDVDLGEIWHMIADQLTDMKKYPEGFDAINQALSHRPNDSEFKFFRENLDHTTSPFLRIAPMKLEEMSLDPYIVINHDFMTDKEIKELQEYSVPKLRRARVREDEISLERSARQANFDGSEIDLFKTLNLRFADMTGLSLEQAEDLYVTNYGLGGHHYIHCDYYNETSRFTRPEGNRLLIIIVFLRDVEIGGALAFANLNFAVPSKKGAAVAFYLLDNAGDSDERSLHGSCPVVYGSKWILLKVFRERAQVFRRPCYK